VVVQPAARACWKFATGRRAIPSRPEVGRLLLLPAAAASSSLFAAFMGFSSMPALSSPAPRHGQKGAMACILNSRFLSFF
jgi:hypothetical protein